MKINITFERYGEDFYCATCHSVLKQKDDEGNIFIHPAEKGWIFKTKVDCQYVGHIIEHPFRNMEISSRPSTK